MMMDFVRSFASIRSLALVGALICGASRSQADLVSVINTGIDAQGNLLADGAVDPHYELITSADSSATGPDAFVVKDGQFPFPYWYANGASQWIAPYADGTTAGDGLYVYRTTFDLTGYRLSTARIDGVWSTDNNGLDIVINGHSTGFTTSNVSYQGPSSFQILGGFVEGVNTLEFRVNNEVQASGNPTGLRVEGAVTAQAVPEPASLAMLATGGLLAMRTARRRKTRLEAEPV